MSSVFSSLSQACLSAVRRALLRDTLRKGHLLVRKGAVLLGVADEKGCLEPNTVGR